MNHDIVAIIFFLLRNSTRHNNLNGLVNIFCDFIKLLSLDTQFPIATTLIIHTLNFTHMNAQ